MHIYGCVDRVVLRPASRPRAAQAMCTSMRAGKREEGVRRAAGGVCVCVQGGGWAAAGLSTDGGSDFIKHLGLPGTARHTRLQSTKSGVEVRAR